jgi:hypothetical protein
MSGSGWSNQVQFLVIVAGGGVAGVYVYDPTAGLGTLIASMTDSTVDPFGNATEQGITSYAPSGGATATLVAQLYQGTLNLGAPDTVNGVGGAAPASVSGGIQPGALTLTSGIASGADTAASLQLESATFSAETVPVINTTNFLQVQTAATPPLAASPAFYSSVNGTEGASSLDGFAGTFPQVQSDTGTNTNANQVSATRISAIYTIPAGVPAGTEYELIVPWSATMESQTLQMGLSLDGSSSFSGSDTIGGAIVGAGVGLLGTIRVRLRIATAGAGGTADVFVDGVVGQSGANALFTNRGSLVGQDRGLSYDTTISHTMRVNTLWGAAAAGQTVSGFGSRNSRYGT